MFINQSHIHHHHQLIVYQSHISMAVIKKDYSSESLELDEPYVNLSLPPGLAATLILHFAHLIPTRQYTRTDIRSEEWKQLHGIGKRPGYQTYLKIVS